MLSSRSGGMFACAAALATVCSHAIAYFPNLVSVTSSAAQGNAASGEVVSSSYTRGSTISADGRFVVFPSYATNFASPESLGKCDVFLRDLQSGTTTRVSTGLSGAEADGDSYGAMISADGRYVAFLSYATNLVAGDSNNLADVFVYDRLATPSPTITLASLSISGTQGNGHCDGPVSISADGRYVAFRSNANNLIGIGNDTNAKDDVFVRDRQTPTTILASVTSGGAQGNDVSLFPALSGDGSRVAFVSYATNLVASDTNGVHDVFVHDLSGGTTVRVSVDSSGNQANAASSAFISPWMSDDGDLVVYHSNATNLDSAMSDTNGVSDVFVHQLSTGATTRISLDTLGGEANDGSFSPTISADGRYVAFSSAATDLVSGDTNGFVDIFVCDLQSSGAVNRVSVAFDGAQGNSHSAAAAIAADGDYVLFASGATNIVVNDTNGFMDVFVHDRAPFPCPGDVDGDGDVDFIDQNIVLSYYGSPVPHGTMGDLNNNGTVDAVDLNIVLSYFGTSC
ncbi:MAG: TolB family protein [Phycisphaerales bacterium]